MRAIITSLSLVLCSVCSTVHAQEVFSSDGGTNVLSGNTISWSIGEPIIGTSPTGSGDMTQGFQQPAEKLIYYSRATGNVTDPIWSRTRTGTAGPAVWGTRSTMVIQAGDEVTNTGSVTVDLIDVEASGILVLTGGSNVLVHGDSAVITGSLSAQDNSNFSMVSPDAPADLVVMGIKSFSYLTINTPGGGTDAYGDIQIRGTLQLDDGDFDASAANVVLHSAATYTGRLGAVSPTASYTGNITMQRYIPSGATNWRLLGSPLANMNVVDWHDDFITAGYPGSDYPNFDLPVGSGNLWPSIRWFDEPDLGPGPYDGLNGVADHLQNLVPGQGFAVWCGDSLGGTASFVIDLENEAPMIATTPIALPMSYTSTGDPTVDGWNLVGNPVPSAIAFDQINRGADVADYVTYYNPANGNSAVYDISLGIGTNGGTNTIQSSQGFYLKTTGPAVSVTVDESDKIDDNTGGIFGGLQQNINDMITLQISSSINPYNDETHVVFNTGTNALDSEDARKYVFSHAAAPQVSTLAPDGSHLAISAYGTPVGALSVPVSVNAAVSGTYDISFLFNGNISFNCLILEDLLDGSFTPIEDGSVHSFYLDANADPDQARFLLHEAPPVAGFPLPLNVEAGVPTLLDNTSMLATSYAWDFGDGSTATDPQPTHIWTSPGTYTVTLTATTGACIDTFTQTVVVSGAVLPLAVKAFLQGPYNDALGLMDDNIRTLPDFPLVEPYTALGYPYGTGGASIAPALLNASGNDAIVDWIVVELRDANDPTSVVASLSGLVQRDGDIVHTDGVSPLPFEVPVASYYVAVRHRNHLGVMTFGPKQLATTTTSINFTDAILPTFGTYAQANINGAMALWSGDVTFDGSIKYTGAANDRDPILLEIGGAVPTNTTTGYKSEDVNMDGTVKYIGSDNDRDPILINIGGSVPTNTRSEQLP